MVRPAWHAMAGLIGLTSADLDVQDATGAVRWAYEGEWVPHPVVRLTTTLPVAVNGEDGVREIVRARWGFPVGPGRPVGNCRDDRLTESRMWASMYGKSHCLFVATGIYEMTTDAAGKKHSWWFRRSDGHPIVMPGLVSERSVQVGDGAPVKRLCGGIITTEPSPFFGAFHNRQVCVLEPAEFDAWMAGGDPEELRSLLHTPQPGAWEAVPIDGRIFGKGRREMEDLQPVGKPVVDRGDGALPDLGASGARQMTLGD